MNLLYKLTVFFLLFTPCIINAQIGNTETAPASPVFYKNNIVYTGSYTYTGSVNNVHIIKTLPAGLKYVSYSTPGMTGSSVTVTGGNSCGGETVDINLGNLTGGIAGLFKTYFITVNVTCPAIPGAKTYVSMPTVMSASGFSNVPSTAGPVTQNIVDPLSWLSFSKSIVAILPSTTVLPFYNLYYHANYDQTIRFKISIGTNSYYCPPACCATALPTLTNIKLDDVLPPSAVLVGATPVLNSSLLPLPAANYTLSGGVLTINSPANYTICSAASLDYYVDIKIPCQTSPTSNPVPNTLLTNTATLTFNSPALHTNYKTANAQFRIEKKEGGVRLAKKYYSVSSSCPPQYYYDLKVEDTGTVKLDNYCIEDIFPPEIIVNRIVTPVSTSCSYTLKYKFVNLSNAISTISASWINYTGNPIAPATNLLIPGAITPPVGQKIYAISICGGGTGCNIPPPDATPPYLHSESTQVYYTINPSTAAGATITNTASGFAHAFDNTLNTCNDPAVNGNFDYTSTVSQTFGDAAFYLNKYICNPKSCYNIGDTINFDYAIQNYSQYGAIPPGGICFDNLASTGLQFISTDKTYISHAMSPSLCPTGGPAFSDITSITSTPSTAAGILGGLITWGLPAGWLVGQCPTANDSVIHIKFSARVLPTWSGLHTHDPNINFYGVTWTNANFNVCAKDSLAYVKELSTDGGITWSSSGTATGGTTIQYRLKLKNSGTLTYPITSANPLVFSDVFPNNSTNEGTISTACGSRGSTIGLTLPPNLTLNFEARLNGTTILPVNYKCFDNYNANLTPDFGTGFGLCNTGATTFSPNNTLLPYNKAFVYSTTTPTAINPGDSIEIFIRNITVPNIASGTTKLACNSFAVKAGATTVGESQKVCLTILPPCLCEGWSATLNYINSSGTTVSSSLTCNNTTPVSLSCNQLYSITPVLICNQSSCNAVIDNYTIDGIGATFTGTSFNIGPFNSPGTHTIVVTGHCGSSQCTCTYKFIVPPCPFVPVCPQQCNYSLTVDSINTTQVITATGSTYNIFNTNLNLNTLGINISEVRVNVIDFTISDENGLNKCLECYNYPVFWASPQGGVMGSISPIYSVGLAPSATTISGRSLNGRELIWNSFAPFTVNSTTPLSFYLPLGNSLPCCKLKANICLKISIRKPDCTECVFYKCISTTL